MTAHSSQLVEGERLRVHYGDQGTWNDSEVGAGLEVRYDGEWIDHTYEGAPYQTWAMKGQQGGEAVEAWVAAYHHGSSLRLLGELDNSTDSVRAVAYLYYQGGLRVTRAERWDAVSSQLLVEISITNSGEEDLTDLRWLFAVEPDQDNAAFGDVVTINDSIDTDGDGDIDFVESLGRSTNRSFAIGACDPDHSEAGHFEDWGFVRDADEPLVDKGGEAHDDAMALRYTHPTSLGPGQTATAAFVVLFAETGEQAQLDWASAASLCLHRDMDADGDVGLASGGSDCDDATPLIGSTAVEEWYNGVDEDCSGGSDFDADGDGVEAQGAPGGQDCDDADPSVHPDAEEIWYDGVDQNCDGNDQDADLDGVELAEDCDDGDASVQVGCDGAEEGGSSSEGGDSANDAEAIPEALGLGSFQGGRRSCSSAGGLGSLLGALLALPALWRRRR